MLRRGKRHKGKEMGVPDRNRTRKFSALKGIAGTNKKGKESGGRGFEFDKWTPCACSCGSQL